MKKRFLILSMLLAGSLCACQKAETPVIEPDTTTTETTVTPPSNPAPQLSGQTPDGDPIDYSTETPDIVVSDGEEIVSDYIFALNYLANGQNYAIAPESLNSALDMYQRILLDGDEKNDILNVLDGRDYLSYVSTSDYKLVNRIWANTLHPSDFSSVPDLQPYVYEIEMLDDGVATDTKNAFVNEMTDGFIPATPTELVPNTVLDIMNIAYFHAAWDGTYNDFTVLPDKIDFKDNAGHTNAIEMVGFSTGEGHSYIESDTAYGVNLRYASTDENEDGMTMIVILPKEGYTISQIDLKEFLPLTAYNYQFADVFNFAMPRIDVNCNWSMAPTDKDLCTMLGLPNFGAGPANTDIVNYSSPALNQIVKIKSDEEGTTAAAVTEIMLDNGIAIDDEPTTFDFICNKPFLYVIYDNTNHDIAFIGQQTKSE